MVVSSLRINVLPKFGKGGIEPPQPIKPVTSNSYGLFDSGDNRAIAPVEALWKQEGAQLC
jgi:hypothetical protein